MTRPSWQQSCKAAFFFGRQYNGREQRKAVMAVSIGARDVLYKPSSGVADAASGKREPDEISDVRV